MTTSYSDQILLALAKHGRLNCQQLANKISHDSKKTTQLVSFMRINKKVRTDGQIDGRAAYSLTDLGRSLVPASAQAAPSTTPTSLDDLADSHMRPAKREAAESEPRAKLLDSMLHIGQTRQAEQGAPAFGLLNTGEFLIIADGHTIKIPAEYVPVMRAQLGSVSAGAFQ
ncbi:hypothetical protein ACOTF1_06635 [Achromobacter ruhlandii]|uniref:hypothetical protein n=1 Tax=Achromobacter ruhlandii TaxID=72557 RepID=UPI003B9D5604